MKELRGQAERTTPASQQQCLSLLEAVDQYPRWYPEVVKSVEVLERDGQGRPSKAQTKLHVQHGPIVKDFDLTMDVKVDPAGRVRLTRVPHHGGDGEKFDVVWRLAGAGPTRIRVDLAAALNVPRFMPLGDVGNSLAAGFVEAATKALTQ